MSKKDKILNWLVKDNEHKKLNEDYRKKINEKELTKSPVSGSFIIKNWTKKNCNKPEIDWNKLAVNFMEISEQSRAKLAKIDNRIGPYECKLCKFIYNDAFELAMHNCPRVVHINYKCSICAKSFNCPANLASHKRWHKPSELDIIKKPKVINIDSEVSKNQRESQLEPAILYNQFFLNNFYSSYHSFIQSMPFGFASKSNDSNIYFSRKN